jgi:hypothetical protein
LATASCDTPTTTTTTTITLNCDLVGTGLITG